MSVAGLLHVSHLCIFTSTELATYLKISRLPQGPTLTFWVHNYSLARDVISAKKKQYVFEKLYQNAPLIVMNSFSGEGLHMKLMASMFQNMFPTINITKVRNVNLSEVMKAFVAFMCMWCCSFSLSKKIFYEGYCEIGSVDFVQWLVDVSCILGALPSDVASV